MTIKKKIQIERVISRGGQQSCDVKEDNAKTQLCLSMTKSFLERVNDAVKEREGMSRNAWILEAIQDKLKQ